MAYLLWDQIATNVVEELVNFYYSLLQERLPASSVYSRDILQQHFDLCVMDFMRWQLGFQGGRHFWAMPWAVETLRRILEKMELQL